MWIEIQNTDWVNRLTYATSPFSDFARFSSLVLMGTVCMHYAFIARCAPTIDVFRVLSFFAPLVSTGTVCMHYAFIARCAPTVGVTLCLHFCGVLIEVNRVEVRDWFGSRKHCKAVTLTSVFCNFCGSVTDGNLSKSVTDSLKMLFLNAAQLTLFVLYCFCQFC